MTELINTRYPERYGSWAGNPKGRAPDYSRCCEEVTRYHGNWPSSGQCTRKRGYGPDGAYCKTHDPAAIAERRAASDAKYNAEWNKRRYEIHGRTFYNALKQIAEGHNDPRTLATEIIAKFHEGDRK